MKNYGSKIAAILTAASVLTAVVSGGGFTAFAEGVDNKTEALSRYKGLGSEVEGWEVSNPFPMSTSSMSGVSGYFRLLNDGSSEYPSEAYLEMKDLSSGLVTFNIAFKADRLMDDLSFRLLSGKNTVFGIVTTEAGKLYLEGAGQNYELCSYSENSDCAMKVTVDMNANLVKKIQINGVTCAGANDKEFITKNAPADGFSIKTGVEAQGLVALYSFYADKGYYVLDDFLNYASTVPDDWSKTGTVTLHSKNTFFYDVNDVCMSASSSMTKTFSQVSGNLTFDINLLQPEKGGSYTITLWGGSNKVSEINSDGSYLYSNSSSGSKKFADFAANVYNHLRLDVKTGTKKTDVYFNSRRIRQNIPFDGSAGYVDKITITTAAGCKPLYIDDIKLYDTVTYASDYPTIGTVPAKASGAPLVSMQVCPMWTQGQHYGWDYINQASDKRKPVLGFYNDCNTEAADWTIKYMLEHGVDFINICMYPNEPGDESSIVSPATDTSVRNTGFINAYLNSRYNDQIKFAIFLEANGLKNIGANYYDDFFEVVLPQYIEMYFKHPQYQKVDGRPIFGIYSIETFFDVMDTGNTAQGKTRDIRITNAINRIRQMCIDAGVGDPYLVAHQSFKYVSPAAARGFDAVTAYNYSTTSDFAVQKKTMENAKATCIEKNIDFIPALMPSCDHVAWRTRAGFAYSGADFESQLLWAKNTLLSGYTPSNSNGQKIINLSTWDEYGEGQILAPTEGNGFMYLDAVRNVMTVGGSHSDAVPNSEQKERIGSLYRQDRTVNSVIFNTEDHVPINSKVYYGKIEREIENGIPTNAVKTWDFKTQEDADKVSASWIRDKSGAYAEGETVSSITRQSDGIKVRPATITGDDIAVNPTITISGIENIDIHNVTYVKIRMKKNASTTGGSVSWSTNFYDKTSTGRAVAFDAYGTDSSSFADYYAPVYESAAWAGKLTSLDITLGRVTDASTDFVVDSVSLLADETIDSKDKIVTSEQTAVLDNSFIEDGQQLMVPFNEAGRILGADSIDIFGSEGRYLLKYGALTSEFTVGENEAKVGGITVSLDAAPYRSSKTISDTVYVPLSLVNEIFYDLDISYDSSTKTLTAVKKAPAADRIIKAVEFDKAGDLTRNVNVTVLSNSGNGYLAVKSNKDDPQLYINIGSTEAEQVKSIEIRLWSDTASQLEVFFQTDNDSTYNGSKRFFAVTKAGYNVIEIDTTVLETWADTITALRIDPAVKSGITTVIDSVAYLSEKTEEPVVTPAPVTPTEKPGIPPFYTVNKGAEITVYGKLDKKKYSGKFVTVMLLDKNVELAGISAADIRGINQGEVGADGKYSITFECPIGISPSDCVVYTRVGDENITSTATTAIASINDLVDYSASVATEGNTASMSVQIADTYGFDVSSLRFVPIMAFYDESGRTVGLRCLHKSGR